MPVVAIVYGVVVAQCAEYNGQISNVCYPYGVAYGWPGTHMLSAGHGGGCNIRPAVCIGQVLQCGPILLVPRLLHYI